MRKHRKVHIYYVTGKFYVSRVMTIYNQHSFFLRIICRYSNKKIKTKKNEKYNVPADVRL
jgi:hypothetical protein